VRIKKPLTTRSAAMKIKALAAFREAGHDVTAIIDQASDHHWLDFYALKEIEVPKMAKAAVEQTRQYLEAEKRREVSAPPPNIRQLVRRLVA
jgi:hypothetical protein